MSLLSYGIDPKVEKRDTPIPVPSRPANKKWRKLILATAGTALCVGSAFAMYQGWSNYAENARIAAERASRPNGMFLESQYASDVKPNIKLLNSGEEIMLRVRGKANLCIDDGGGWTVASSKFTNKPCNPSSPNQIFKYNPSTKEFASVYKTGLCIDDGGSWNAAGTKAHLWYCDPNNQNQWFVMDPLTLMLRNPVKNNLCFDDGGGMAADSTKYVMWYCDNNNPNQHFEVVSRADMAEEKKRKVGTTMYDLMVSGKEIMLRVRGKNMCVDDGGAWFAATTKFVDMPCNPNSPNQAFKYNIKTGELESVAKPGLCIDDGGSWNAAGTKAHLWYCDINNQNQWFDMDESTLMLKNPLKDNLCLDDGGGQTAGLRVTKFVDMRCNPDSPNQVFKYNVRTLEFENVNKPGLCMDDGGSWDAGGTTAHLWYCDANNQNQWFVLDESTLMLRNPMKEYLCFDDGGGAGPATTKFIMGHCDINSPNQHFEILPRSVMIEEKKKVGMTAYDILASGQEIMLRPCDPDSPNQVFKYDASTREFENVNKPGFCIDDGGSWDAAGSAAHLWYCDPNNQNQWFVLDEDTMMIHNPMKSNFCFDDGGGTTAGASKYIMWWCNNDSPNQHFEVIPRATLAEEVRKKRIAAGIDDDFDLLNSGQKIMLRVRGKDNLCVDDGGGRWNGATKFNDQPCDPSSLHQVFTYDAKTHQFRSVNKPGLCIDDGGAWNAAGSQAHLWDCDQNNQNQWFVFDEDTMMLRNPVKNNLCFDDGGGAKPGETKYILYFCDDSNPNQHFEILSHAKMAEEKKQRLIAAGLDDEWIFSTLANRLCCVPNQLFTYDPNTRQFRSVNKLGLCMDDGGGWNAAESQAHLWDCDPNNQNQWFVWDENSMTLRNPAKRNLCFDDGGGMTAGCLSCRNDGEKKKAQIAAGTTAADILATGQEIMLRVRGKANLCVDDGGGHSNGETKFVDQPCNPNSPNQIFTYNAMTHQFNSANKPGMCMDDGGAWNAAGSQAHLWECDPNNQNQWFVMDEDTLMLHNPVKENLCFDDGGGTAPGQTNTSCGSVATTTRTNTLSHLLYSGQHLMLRIRGKDNFCVRWWWHSSGETKFITQPCDPRSPNQIFTYDASTHQFKSVNKPGLCMDDGGGWSPAQTTAHLWDCDQNNQNQWFILDEDNMMLRNPVKDNLCFDDDGGRTPAETKFWLWTCDIDNPNQHFEIISPASIQVPGVPNPDRIGAKYLDLLKSGQQSMNQLFSYDINTREFRSVVKPGMCLDDGGGWSAGESTAHLWKCDAGNENQWFEFDPDTLMLHRPAKPDLCFDDGSGQENFFLWYCNIDNPNQQFEILSRGAMLGIDAMPPPPFEVEEGPWNFDGDGYVLPPGPIQIDQVPQPLNPEDVTSGETTGSTTDLGWEQAPAGDIGPANGVDTGTNPNENELLPDQEDGNVAPPDVPVVAKADMPLATYGDGDWNLLAPSNNTIDLVNSDKSSAISAAEIFQYLQTLKDRADMEHQVTMYRYKRTYQCASAGLQTLAKDAVTEDEYHVLVQWMYDHCAAGATDVVPDANPSPPLTDDVLKSDDVGPLVDDTDVKRQFMTKLDFYYEIKNHYAHKNAELMGEAAVANLRAEETETLEKKLVDCIEEASERYGYNKDGKADDSAGKLSFG
ncbi:Ricin B, lectin domain [Phytophthora cactorum]|nr:Ricin B, lectin domain [Phytophthora cactorum]